MIDRWDILADEDVDLAHGTFIAGLAAAGGALNGAEICPEPDGAELVNLAVFPNERKAGAFASYYPDGLPQFFDEMESAGSDARARHGVRVFNMSLNVPNLCDAPSLVNPRIREPARWVIIPHYVRNDHRKRESYLIDTTGEYHNIERESYSLSYASPSSLTLMTFRKAHASG